MKKSSIPLLFLFLFGTLNSYSATEGESCSNPIIISEPETEITFPENESQIYIEFEAPSNEIFIHLLNSQNGDFPEIYSIDVYSKENCSELNLEYSYDNKDTIYHREQVIEVNEEGVYLYVIERDPNGDLPEAFFNFKFGIYSQSSCSSYPPCEEFKNGDFSNLKQLWANLNKTYTFGMLEVCDWEPGGASPQIIKNGSNYEAKMYSRYFTNNYNQPERLQESVLSSYEFSSGTNYIMSFSLRKHGTDCNLPFYRTGYKCTLFI